jgi:transcriptional regulator with XRE-family HTH domain
MSQTALAKKANVTKGHLSDVERGVAGFSPEFLARVATALDCTIEDLMPDDEVGAAR